MDTSGEQVTTIDEYINAFPAEVKTRLHLLRATIKEVAPDAEETIKYRMPTFIYHGNLVYFAAFKNHIGFYPTPSGVDDSIEGLAQYKAGKGTLQFPLDQPLPLDLVRQIVEQRVQENLAKKQSKKPKKSQPS